MVSSTLYTAILASIVTIVSTTPISANTLSKGNPIVPSKDPFYIPDPGYEKEACGTILRSRPPPAPLSAFGIVPMKLKSSYQILYRTTDAQGNPQATVTTVLVPHGANMSRLVSFQDFEDSACPDCATSYGLQKSSGLLTLLTKADVVVAGGLLAKGWVVSMPDYEGPKAATFSGLQCGQATLDGVRAVLNSQDITGIAQKNDVEVQLWGYSGGSIPTEWAAELQPTYAPELKSNLKAAVVGGTITNLTSAIFTIDKTSSAGFGLAGILGLTNSYPDYMKVLKSEVLPKKQKAFFRPLNTCGILDLPEFQYQSIGSYFKDGLGIFNKPETVKILQKDGIMGLHGLPQIPLYFYKAVHDEISPIADNDKLVDGYCSKGIESLVYERNLVGNHAGDHFMGCGGAIGYMNDRFNGVPVQKGCLKENVIISKLDWSAFGGYKDEVKTIVEELFGEAIGPTTVLEKAGQKVKSWFSSWWDA